MKEVAGWLNACGTSYAIHGSWAVRMWGVDVVAEDIDVVIPYVKVEYEKVKLALGNLPQKKTLVSDVSRWMQAATYRSTDEYIIDVSSSIRDMTFQSFEIIPVIIGGGLTIPFLSGDTLFRLMERGSRHVHKFSVYYESLRQLGYDGVYENKVIDPDMPNTPKEVLVQVDHALVVTEDFLSAGD